ncbi:hypothetical protein [Streptomyces sp. NPDC001851]|uniref:hypothetical protein n=1 Tax=Streptomyces sp. NPDC001851 TaxID=3154529 RepID=UPI0033312B18
MPNDPGPLFTQRTALILLLGALTGVGAGFLTLRSGSGAAGAVLCGCGAFAGAVAFFHSVIA